MDQGVVHLNLFHTKDLVPLDQWTNKMKRQTDGGTTDTLLCTIGVLCYIFSTSIVYLSLFFPASHVCASGPVVQKTIYTTTTTTFLLSIYLSSLYLQ